MKKGWFSSTPEAIDEQRVIVAVLEHCGVDIHDVIGDAEEFNLATGRNVIEKCAEQAWKTKAPFARKYGKKLSDFKHKLLGNWMEYLCDAVVNSQTCIKLLPKNWVTSKHRSEFGIPDLERGSPDRLLFDEHGQFHSLVSVKLVGGPNVVPENLDNAFSWAANKYSKYDIGDAPGIMPKCALFTNGKNAAGLEWPGGQVSSDVKGNTLHALIDRSKADTKFWREFFAEFKLNVSDYDLIPRARPAGKVPDQFQTERVVDVVAAHTGPGIVNGACGFGKTVCQIATLPRDRSISVYMAGARLSLAGQANREFDISLGVPSHRLYVMSASEFQSRVDSNILVEKSIQASESAEIAYHLYEYAIGAYTEPLIVITIEQSLYKVLRALLYIKNGNVVNPETGILFDWCDDPDVVSTVWEKVQALCKVAHFDEAHNLATGEKKDPDPADPRRKLETQQLLTWSNTVFDRSIFWTATVITNNTSMDMKNVDVFGEVIATVRGGEAIERGYTVPACIVEIRVPEAAMVSSGITSDDAADLELTFYIRSIEDAISRLRVLNQPCQLIVFTSNKAYHTTFRNKLIEHFSPTIPDFWCNFVESETDAKTRELHFTEFKNSKVSILLNYNIVSEGIDIDSCSGVIMGRGMEERTMVQAAGRGCRLSTEDRAAIKEGTLTAGAYTTYQKKFGLVYVLVDESNGDSIANQEQLENLIVSMLAVNNFEPWWINASSGSGIAGRNPPTYENSQAIGAEPEALFDYSVSSAMYIVENQSAAIQARLIEEHRTNQIKQVDLARKQKAAADLEQFFNLFDE